MNPTELKQNLNNDRFRQARELVQSFIARGVIRPATAPLPTARVIHHPDKNARAKDRYWTKVRRPDSKTYRKHPTLHGLGRERYKREYYQLVQKEAR